MAAARAMMIRPETVVMVISVSMEPEASPMARATAVMP